MDRNTFEKKIKPILQYIGILGAAVTCVAYIIIVVILIVGFKASTILQTTTFAIVNAAIGLVIMQMLKYQGQIFAENIPENQEILKLYYRTKTKDKKPLSIKHYWVTSVVKDVIIKGVSLAATSIGLILIVIEGTRDYKLLLLALANLIMFACFGLLGLNKTYEFYNNEHIPYILDQLKQQNIIVNVSNDKDSEKPKGENVC